MAVEITLIFMRLFSIGYNRNNNIIMQGNLDEEEEKKAKAMYDKLSPIDKARFNNVKGFSKGAANKSDDDDEDDTFVSAARATGKALKRKIFGRTKKNNSLGNQLSNNPGIISSIGQRLKSAKDTIGNTAKNALVNTGSKLLNGVRNTANTAKNLIGFNNQDGQVKNPDEIVDEDLNVVDLYGAKYKILVDDESDTVCVTQVNDDLINALKASKKPNFGNGGKIIKKRRTRKIRKTRKKRKMGKK